MTSLSVQVSHWVVESAQTKRNTQSALFAAICIRRLKRQQYAKSCSDPLKRRMESSNTDHQRFPEPPTNLVS